MEDKINCKSCAKEFVRLKVGYYPTKDGGVSQFPKYVDQNGKTVNGRNCPSCELERNRRFRATKKAEPNKAA